SEGPISGGTSTILSGQNFAGPGQVKVGAQLAASPAVTSSQIQVASPPSVVNGVVNLTANFQNSWLVLAPDAFSYGPQILQVLPGRRIFLFLRQRVLLLPPRFFSICRAFIPMRSRRYSNF